MDIVLLQGQQVEFFNDEFFCLVYVKYMVNVVISENLVIRCPKKTWLSGMSSTCRILWNSFFSNALSCDMVLLFFIPINNYTLSVISTMVTVWLTSTYRLQMAESVAVVRGYSHSIIKSVSASASSVLISSLWWNVASKHPYPPVNTHALFQVSSKHPYLPVYTHALFQIYIFLSLLLP